MPVVVGEAEADQNNVAAQVPFEHVEDRQRTALAHKYWFTTERFPQRDGGFARATTAWRLPEWMGMMSLGHRQLQGGGVDSAQVLRYKPRNCGRFLVGHEWAGDFGARPSRHDGLRSGALITAGDAVDLERGPCPASFERRVSL